MGESTSHIILVSLLAQWIASTFLDGDTGHILIDAPDRNSRGKPPKVYDFVPDVYVMNAPRCGLIIGEAKTAEDVEKKHTVERHFCANAWSLKVPFSCLRFLGTQLDLHGLL